VRFFKNTRCGDSRTYGSDACSSALTVSGGKHISWTWDGNNSRRLCTIYGMRIRRRVFSSSFRLVIISFQSSLIAQHFLAFIIPLVISHTIQSFETANFAALLLLRIPTCTPGSFFLSRSLLPQWYGFPSPANMEYSNTK